MQGISKSTKQKAIKLIKEGQGLYLNKYDDTLGYPTIGYGHKIDEKKENFDKPITVEKAESLLQTELKNRSYPEVEKYWGETFDNLCEERQAVLIDMTFNMGSVRWPKFTKALQKGDYEEAAKEIMNSKYAAQVKLRAQRNAAIMRDGILYSKESCPKKK